MQRLVDNFLITFLSQHEKQNLMHLKVVYKYIDVCKHVQDHGK